jgi:hypothetical protein
LEVPLFTHWVHQTILRGFLGLKRPFYAGRTFGILFFSCAVLTTAEVLVRVTFNEPNTKASQTLLQKSLKQVKFCAFQRPLLCRKTVPIDITQSVSTGHNIAMYCLFTMPLDPPLQAHVFVKTGLQSRLVQTIYPYQ